MGIATVRIVANLSAFSTNLSLLTSAVNTLSLVIQTAFNQAQFRITIIIAGVSRADFDSIKTVLAGFELPSSPIPLSLEYSETGS